MKMREGRQSNTFIYADHILLMAKKREDLEHIMDEFKIECYRTGLKMNVSKRKVLVVNIDQRTSCEKVKVNVDASDLANCT